VDRVAVITGRIAAVSAQSGGIYGNQEQVQEDHLTCHTWLSTANKTKHYYYYYYYYYYYRRY
jgi:hypothetical protein